MSEITHDEAVEELAGVVLGSASQNISERVRAHAGTCSECQMEMAELEATTRQLGDVIPEHPINPGRAAGIRSRLISRASADTDRRVITVPASTASRVKTPLPTKTPGVGPARIAEAVPEKTRARAPSSAMAIIAGLAGLVAVGAVIQMIRANAEAESLRATIQVQPDTAYSEPKPTAQTPDADKIIAAVTGADVKIIPLTHYGARGPVARMFWNRESNTWTLVTYSIRQPKPDKVFQVWLSTSSGTISGGTFVPDQGGRALVQSNNAVRRDGLYSISVTEEEKGGAPTPSGPAVIAGAP